MDRLAFVVAMALLAGCTTPSQGGPERPPEPALNPNPFTPPRLIGGGGDLETTLIIRDDAWLVCEMGSGDAHVLLASLDGGANWNRIPIDRGNHGSTDCDIAIGSDGTWYIVFLDTLHEQVITGSGFTNGLLVFGSSSDHGTTWVWTTIPGHGNGLVDRPWIRAVSGGTIYLTHKSFNLGLLTVWFQKSSDQGITWSQPTLVHRAADPARPNGNVGKMVVSEDGREIRLPLHTFNSQEGVGRDEWLEVAASLDAGARWTIHPVVGPVQTRADFFLPSLGIANETLYVSVPFANGRTGADLTIVVSDDDGASWSDPLVLARNQDFTSERAQASVALDAGLEGIMDAAWYHWENGWVTSLARIEGRKVQWVREVSQPSGVAAQLEFLGLAHDRIGRAHIAYPVPTDPCPEFGGRDCIWLISEK